MSSIKLDVNLDFKFMLTSLYAFIYISKISL